MKLTRMVVVALLLVAAFVTGLFALLPRTVSAQSGVTAAPPAGAACKVMLRTGMMEGFGKSITFGQGVLSGTVKSCSDNWLALTITSDPSRPVVWVPRDNICAVVYVNARQ